MWWYGASRVRSSSRRLRSPSRVTLPRVEVDLSSAEDEVKMASLRNWLSIMIRLFSGEMIGGS